MKTRASKIVSLLLVAVMALSCCFVFTACPNEEPTFYIGASGPLSGGAAVYGTGVKNGAQMAVDEINAAGGINGVKVKFVMMDDKHDASNVSTNFASMFEAGMQMSLGCVTTGPCKEWKTLSNEENVFFMTPSASADTIVQYSNAYQMCFADNKQGKAAAEHVNDEWVAGTISKVGVLYKDDDAYSTGIWTEFEANLDTAPSATMVTATFSGDSVASFQSQIDLLKDCDFIFMPIYYGPASQFMTEAKNDVAADAVYYGCDGLDGIDTSVDGFDITSIPQQVSYLSHFVPTSTETAVVNFIAKYTAKYGTETMNQFAASAYDCVYAITGALKQAMDKNESITVESSAAAICTALKAEFQGGFTFSGVTGKNVTWDEDGFVSKAAYVCIVKEADSAE